MSEESTLITTMLWRGIRIELKHELCYSTMRDLHHLEILSVEPDRAPLPFTETGFRSHFYYGEPIKDVIAAVTVWLDEDAEGEDWKAAEAKSRQLTLF